MNSKLSSFCDGLLEAGWLVAVISVPLFFNIHSERVFEPDKVTILRSIAILLFFVWLVRFVDQRGWKDWNRLRWQHEESIWRIPFLLPILALVIVYSVSTLFSVMPRISWAGSYQRLQGTYTTLAYVVFYVSAVSTMRLRLQISRLPTAVIITSIPIAFYGLIQHFGLDPLPWGGDVTTRVAGHLGNAIFIAAYLIMVVPLTLGRIIDAFSHILSDESLSVADMVRSSAYIFALATQLLTIYWSGSRGPLIGLATGLFSFILILLVSLRNAADEYSSLSLSDVFLALALIIPPFFVLLTSGHIGASSSAIFSFSTFFAAVILSLGLILLLIVLKRGWKWLWLSWLMLTVLVAGWLFIYNVPSETQSRLSRIPLVGNVLEEQLRWKELPTIGSYGRMLDPSQNTGREKSNRVRVLIWDGVIDLLSPHSPLSYPDGTTDPFNFWRPLIGYGPESMYVAYNRFYPPELATIEARNASPDRSHNETFDALVITGLAGFLAWQALYLSVFYYGLRFLGITRSRKDLYILVGSWVGGALLGALLSVSVFDPIYLGVAIPTGTILGLVIYLFYYALFARYDSGEQENDRQHYSAFETDRLLVNALLAAILAHYVEVHFGIVIAATRLHFFLYVAIMFVVSFKLPQMDVLKERIRGSKKKRHNDHRAKMPGVWGPIMAWSFLLALVVGTLGYNFMNYVLPVDKVVESGADLMTGEIFNQSLFVNTLQGFRDSPFVFLMIVISWALGAALVLSEMIRNRTLSILPHSDGNRASTAGVSLATFGLILSFPIIISGSWIAGLSIAIISSIMLLLLWKKAPRSLLLPALVLSISSLAIGIGFSYSQAVLVREALLYLIFLQGIEPISPFFDLFFKPGGPVGDVVQARVIEARQSTRFLTSYYLFLFLMLILAGISLARRMMAYASSGGRAIAYAAAVVGIILGALAIKQTNMRTVQADMVFKRGRPFDDQALRLQDPLAWDITIGIYEDALELAPLQDYYYLFLGRAYLERSGITSETQNKMRLLSRAEQHLVEARVLNPLNTDHSANLARLNTRWAVAVDDQNEKELRLNLADSYYQDALLFSPQNSVIRNELARLAFDLRRDCDLAIDTYGRSLTIDPFFSETYFGYADVLAACAVAQTDDGAMQQLNEAAIEILETGLSLEPNRPRAWIQAGQIYQQLFRYSEALTALEQARNLAETSDLPSWNVDFLEARVFFEMGNLESARALAEQALQSAPEDVSNQIQTFLDSLEQ